MGWKHVMNSLIPAAPDCVCFLQIFAFEGEDRKKVARLHKRSSGDKLAVNGRACSKQKRA
jgi:hypothetical protein